MFELAARLVGVYKVNHMVCRSSEMATFETFLLTFTQTKSVTIENKDYIQAAA